ncbi:MAG: MBL fold metallo-hydrolase [Pseudomonadota bacterium]
MGEIDVIKVRDFLTYFHWGRHPHDRMLDMRLGGGAYAVHQNGKAVVIDSMARPGQGRWVRDYLAATCDITQFTLVSSHWHVDHIVDNVVFSDGMIVGHKHTRAVMLEKRQQFESGNYSDYDAFTVVPPNLTFEGRLDIWVDDNKLELHEVLIHEAGHLGVFLPDHNILIANDLLEDPLWFFDFDFATAETQLRELERLRNWDIDCILPCHAAPDRIRQGGFSKRLIDANTHYLNAMLANADNPGFNALSAQEILRDYLDAGDVSWWEPYAEVHAANQAAILKARR